MPSLTVEAIEYWMQIEDLLRQARRMLVVDGWTKCYRQRDDGSRCAVYAVHALTTYQDRPIPLAVKVFAVNLLGVHAWRRKRELDPAFAGWLAEWCEQFLGEPRIHMSPFNDESRTTLDDVLLTFDRAIADAEGRWKALESLERISPCPSTPLSSSTAPTSP